MSASVTSPMVCPRRATGGVQPISSAARPSTTAANAPVASSAVRPLPSGSRGYACLWSMNITHVAYVVITILAALANGYAAFLNFVRAESVKVAADQVRVSQKWMIPFGILLASGALGLLIGVAVPVLGTAAAIGLVLYFSCALSAHIRVRDHHIAGAASFLVLAVAALIADLGYSNHWG